MLLSILRKTSDPLTPLVVVQLPVLDSFMFFRTLMQEHKVTITDYTVYNPLPIQINDFIMFKGKKYTINTVPDVEITNTFTYGITFEAPEYTLYDKILFHEGVSDFPYYGDASAHLDLLLSNINEIDPGWTKGAVEPTKEIWIDYVDLDCRLALVEIAEKFGLEYDFDNKEITLVKKIGIETALQFEYGPENGFYQLDRNYMTEKNIKTKIYGFGSDRNLPVGYRGMSKPKLTFDERFILKNEDIYGIKEHSFTNDEIFPNRISTVTAASPIVEDEPYTITDSSLDFDLNDHRLTDVWMIEFTDGPLTGEQFEILKYDHPTKTITYKGFTNDGGVDLPNDTFKPEIGNKFIFLNISMPPEYLEEAELKVKEQTIEAAEQLSVPHVEYGVAMDPMFIRDNNLENLSPGDKVTVKNVKLDLLEKIRVTSISHPINFPNVLNKETRFDATISNFVVYDRTERAASVANDAIKQVAIADKRNIELARRNTANFRNLQDYIVDPDGYFHKERFKALIIEGYMLSIGAKSQNFILNGAKFQPNLLGDANSMGFTAGELNHLEIEIPGVGYTWNIASKTISGLNPLKYYYMYAKCSRTALTGTWELSETPVLADETPGYYNFNIGILYKVNGGYRDYDFTYGLTTIVGDNIVTGRVKDITGQNYFDLRTGQFNLGGGTRGIDWNVTNVGYLTIKGAIAQSASGDVDYVPVYRGDWNNFTPYYLGDVVKYTDGNYYKWINPGAQGLTNINPTITAYWRIGPEKGAAGPKGPFALGRGDWDFSKTYYGTADRIEVVKYGSLWYQTLTTAGAITPGTLPTDTTKYAVFGASFESVATDLLFATLAYIDNLGVRFLRTSDSGKRLEIDGDKNSLDFFISSGARVINIDDDSAVDNGALVSSSLAFYDVYGNPTWVYIKYIGGSPDPTYFYQPKDVGISIGISPTDSGGYTQIGRKKIQTNGSIISTNNEQTQYIELNKGVVRVYDAINNMVVNGVTGSFTTGDSLRFIGGILVP